LPFAKILNYTKNLDRERRSRAEGVAEGDPAEKVKTTAVRGLRKKTPAFALAGSRHLWEPVSHIRASVLHDVVQEQ
jgi:hypothetical protein